MIYPMLYPNLCKNKVCYKGTELFSEFRCRLSHYQLIIINHIYFIQARINNIEGGAYLKTPSPLRTVLRVR